VALAADLTETDARQRFHFGIGVLLSGLLARKGETGRASDD
jgi:hypothetical protein